MTSREDKEGTGGIIGRIARIREGANQLIEQELKRHGMTGIVPAHGAVLHFLFRQQEPVPIKTVVSRIGRVKSTTTGIVNTLVRHGYVFKRGCGEDGRSILVGLTEKGLALQQDFEAISERLLAAVYGTMPVEDRQKLMALLGVIEQNLDPARRKADR